VVVLPNGYLIERNEAADPMLIKRCGGKVIQKPVAAYTVYRDVVTGIVKSSRPASALPKTSRTTSCSTRVPPGQHGSCRGAAWNGG
jgi:hypothetical protein